MKKVVLEGKAFLDKASAHKYLKEQLDFPSYYGNNLDALWDSLSEKRDLVIEIHEARKILKQMGDYGFRLLDLLSDVDHANPRIELIVKW